MTVTAATLKMPARRIAGRTRGDDMGAIVRLFGPWGQRQAPYTPSEFGEMLKPFIFMDLFNTYGRPFTPLNANPNNLHPHSGLATLTYVMSGTVAYEDTTGATGVMPEGAVEWFHAAAGAWHGGQPGAGGCRGFQLWVALPPEEELGEVESIYLPKEQVPQVGPAAILLGSYKGASSPLPAPADMTYVGVRLRAGERWRYEPPANHTVAWIALGVGSLRAPELIEAGEAVAFEPSNEALDFEAVSDSEFVLGSAVKHPYPLTLGHYSVHTSPEALRKGEARIREIRSRLIAEGRLGPQ